MGRVSLLMFEVTSIYCHCSSTPNITMKLELGILQDSSGLELLQNLAQTSHILLAL